jgi:hypothetical protein
MRGRAGVVRPQLRRTLAQLPQGGLQPTHQTQERLREATRRPLPVRIRQDTMAEQMIEDFALNRHRQLPGIGPIQLQQFAGLVRLRKKHLPLRPLRRPPLPHPPIKSAQMTFSQTAFGTRQKILVERLGLQLRRRLQHLGRRCPNLFQWIRARSPRVLDLQFPRTLPSRNVFARRVSRHVRLQCADRDLARLLIFFHEPLVLLFGNHLAAVWNQTDPKVSPPNRRSILPAHWSLLIGTTGQL